MKKSLKIIAMITILAAVAAALAGCSPAASGPKVKVIDIPLTQEEYAFGVNKNKPEIL